MKILLQESNPLFDDIIKKLADYTELRRMLQNILFTGAVYPFNRYDVNINLGEMFGFLKEEHQTVQIANRIFETFLYNVFLSEELTSTSIYKAGSLEKKS